jgi:hypothetical protein
MSVPHGRSNKAIRFAGEFSMSVLISVKSTKPGLEQFATEEIKTELDGVLAFFLAQEGCTGVCLMREGAPVYALAVGLRALPFEIRTNGSSVRNGIFQRSRS